MTLKYSHKIQIDCPQERAFTYLSDYYNQKQLHPYVVEVRQFDPGNAIRRYQITESIKMLCSFKEVHVFVDIVFEEYPRVTRNRVNPGMGVRILGELVIEKLSEERCSVESRGEVDCYWFFRGKIERDIRHAHTTMLHNLKKVLENENKVNKEIIALIDCSRK